MSDFLTAITRVAGFIGGLVILKMGASKLATKLNRKRAPDSQYIARITPAGLMLMTIIISGMLAGNAIRELQPISWIGIALNSAWGRIVCFMLWSLVFIVSAIVFEKSVIQSWKKRRNLMHSKSLQPDNPLLTPFAAVCR